MSSTQHMASATASPPSHRTLVDSWYSEALAPYGVTSVDAAIAKRFPRGLLGLGTNIPDPLRGVLWFIAAKDAERVVCTFNARGLAVFLALLALTGRKSCRVYLLEFLRAERTRLKARIKDAVHKTLYRWLLPRTLSGAQVNTQWEADAYAQKYGLSPNLFSFIPYPMQRERPGDLPPMPAESSVLVMASGRACTDWPTLFAAAKGTAWPLTVVCSTQDLAEVKTLNHDGRATVLCELPHAEHQRLLSRATVYALVMSEQHVSSGQVRLGRAIEAGVPVVATSILGLKGYLENGTTGMAVPVGNAEALRTAIAKLIGDPELRQTLRTRAYEETRSQSLATYIEQIRAFVLDVNEL